jgi:REP element-mobilizing transposase RayT
MENSIFRKSINKAIIEEIAFVLEDNHIPFKLVDNEKYFDATFVNNASKIEYQIMIDRSDFEKAEEIMTDYYSKNMVIPEDYYLKEFSDNELKEIIYKKDEWNEFDYEVAKKLLAERGIIISDIEINQINSERLESLKKNYDKPDDVKNLITFGYIFAVIGCLASFFMGFLLFISYGISLAILKSKKQLPNGERVYYFNKEDRRHGKRILMISIVFTVFWTIFFMCKNN